MLHSVVRDAVRRSTMTVLVEIVCSVSQEESARSAHWSSRHRGDPQGPAYGPAPADGKREKPCDGP
jgi:hypothetical protein